jgi:hypothetical protein
MESIMISVVESAVNCAVKTTFVFKTNKIFLIILFYGDIYFSRYTTEIMNNST